MPPITSHLSQPHTDTGHRVESSFMKATNRARTFKSLRSPGIDSKESISPAYVAWRAGTSNEVFVPAYQAGNQFLGH